MEVQYDRGQYSMRQYIIVQYSTVQYNTVQYSTVQYNTIQYSTIQYSTVQYSTVIGKARTAYFIKSDYMWSKKTLQPQFIICLETTKINLKMILHISITTFLQKSKFTIIQYFRTYP